MDKSVGIVAVILALAISTLFFGITASSVVEKAYCSNISLTDVDRELRIINTTAIKELALAIVGALAGFLGYTLGIKAGVPYRPPEDKVKKNEKDNSPLDGGDV